MNFENSDPKAPTPNVSFSNAFRTPTHYDVLNLDANATNLAIRESYLRLKNLYSSNSDGLYGMAAPEDTMGEETGVWGVIVSLARVNL